MKDTESSLWAVSDLSIVDVVNLVKDHPLQVSDDLWAVVKHRPERQQEQQI